MADMVDNAASVEQTAPAENAAPETTEATQEQSAEQQTEEKSAVDAINAGLEGEGQKEEPSKEQEAAPEKYEFNLPEGLTITPEIETRFTEIAKEMGLTQKQADSLIKLHSDIMMDEMAQAQKMKNAWASECQKAGYTTPDNIRGIRTVFEAFDPSGAAKKAMIESGLIYSPDVMGMLVTMGSVLMEDSAPDNKPATVAKSGADLLFQNSKY